MQISSPRTWIFFIYLCFVLYLSINTFEAFNSLWKYDKYIHFIEYLILGVLLVNAMMVKDLSHQNWILIILFLLFFPIIDETVQRFTLTRIPSVYDGLTDIAGGLIGAFIRKNIRC